MKKVLSIVLSSLTMYLLLAGCSPQASQVVTEKTGEAAITTNTDRQNRVSPDKKLLIACIVNQDDQYMKMLQLGMSDAANRLGANVILANTNGKLDKEIDLINMYIKSGVDGISIHPVSVDLSVPILAKAKESGVKVISAGIAIEDKYNIRYLESDQWELGKKTGEACRDFIENNLGGNANIAILNYKSQFPGESYKRTEGFKSEVTKLPGVKVIVEQEAWLYDTAVTQASSIISLQSDLNIIWAANEGGTVGATIAVKNSGMAGKIFVFGTDVSEQLLNMLLSGENILQALTGQEPYQIGLQSMEQLIGEINGDQSNRNIITIHGIPLLRSNQDEVKKFLEDFKENFKITIGAE